MMKVSLFALAVTALAAPMAFADAIPYPHAGTIAPTVTTTASTSGGVNVYFYGSTAAYTDYVEVIDLATGYNSGEILNNHTTAVGTEVSVGTGAGQIHAGDQLIFDIVTPYNTFSSLPADSPDGINHAYVTTYTGGTAGIPAGLFVGLEDEPYPNSDLNYNDDTFVFTGVSTTSATPEPGSMTLLGTGLLSLAGIARRKFRRS